MDTKTVINNGTNRDFTPTDEALEAYQCLHGKTPLSDTLSNLECDLRKFRAVRSWVKLQQTILNEGCDMTVWLDCHAESMFIEAKYGRRNIKTLAGLYRDRKLSYELRPEEKLKRAEFHVEGRIAALESFRDKMNEINR